MGKSSKRKVSPQQTPRKGVPRPALPGAETSADRLCWRFKHFDHDGPWSFRQLDPATLERLMRCLANLETMTANEIFCGSPGKDYEVASIPTKAAADRLEAINLNDQTQISRLQLSGKERLYGFRDGNVFHVVWWDPEHQVWPSTKRNT